MPARLAISSVDAPWSPRSANSPMAASRISSRRSSALFRCGWVIMGGMLVTTYKLVKRLRHNVQIPLDEPRMEGKRESAFERAVRTRELALVAIGAEAVQGV